MRSLPRHTCTQRGNILFLILLGVVLFAALNYAVTSSMQGGGKNGSSESAKSAASTYLQYGYLVEQAINRLLLTNGCTESQISFENSFVSGYANASTPSDGRCKIFDSAGGGVSWQIPSSELTLSNQSYYFTLAPVVNTGLFQETNVSSRCISQPAATLAQCTDLIMVLFDVPEAVCTEINTAANIAAPIQSEYGVSSMGLPFNGVFLNRSHDDIGIYPQSGVGAVRFNGKLEGCYQMNNGPLSGKYTAFYVLRAR